MFNKLKNIIITLTLLQSIYVIYMLNYYKSSLNFSILFDNNVVYNITGIKSLEHSLNTEYSNKICSFGHTAAYYLAIFLIIRMIILIISTKYNKNIRTFSYFALIITIALSLMNLNCFIYLIPYFITEFYIITYIIV